MGPKGLRYKMTVIRPKETRNRTLVDNETFAKEPTFLTGSGSIKDF